MLFLTPMLLFVVNTKWEPPKVNSLSRLPFDLGLLIEYSQPTHISDGHFFKDPVDRK